MIHPPDPIVTENQDRLAIIDLSIYEINTVLAAVYTLTDKCFVHLQTTNQNQIEIRLRAKKTTDDADFMIRELFNNLLDQQLRKVIAKETSGIRDLLMAHALSRTTFIRPDLEEFNPQEDPNHVSIPDRLKRTAP